MNNEKPQRSRPRSKQQSPPQRRLARRPELAGESLPPELRASAERLRRIERRKARTRAIWMGVVVLAIMFVTVVIILELMQGAKPKPRFQFIQAGEISHTIPATALILRDETVFNTQTGGTLKPLTSEGNRAAKGQKVALVIPANRDNDLRQLQKTEKDIVDRQNELMDSGQGTGAKSIFTESRAQLATLVNLTRSDSGRGDLSSLHSYKISMDAIIEQRNTRLLAIDFKDVRLDQLRVTKANLEKQLGLDSGTIVCQQPGIVSFRLDGLESLDVASGISLTYQDFQKHLAAAPERLELKTTVKAGDPVLRIISSLGQVLALEVEGINASNFEIGKTYDVSLPKDGIRIENCTVLRSEQQDKNTFLVLKTDRRIEWLADRRSVDTILTYSSSAGMKVPRNAVYDQDEASGTGSVMLVVGGYTRSTKVKIIDQDGEFAIIEAIEGQEYKPEVSAVIVLNPTVIEAGEFIGN